MLFNTQYVFLFSNCSNVHRNDSFKELSAMAVEYGTPQFFVTFTGLVFNAPLELNYTIIRAHHTVLSVSLLQFCTANELGWSDLTEACDGLQHTLCPVETNRIYNYRWDKFRKTYLATGPSPLGDITRVWWRHEDQVLIYTNSNL